MRVLVCVLTLFALSLGALGGRIIGGWDAHRGQFPHQISAQYCVNDSCQHSCGGSILSPTWILTAAHCITETSGGTYMIVAGILNLTDSLSEKQAIMVVESVVHPGYPGGISHHDVGLWKLEHPLQYNQYIQSIALPDPLEDVQGKTVLSGWGSVGTFVIFPIMPDTLQTVEIPIVPVDECKLALETILGRSDPLDVDNNICTGPLTKSISACTGDSGGPLIQDNKVVGIVSWGISPCGTIGAPSVYGKVSNYVEWIKSYVDDIV